MIKQKWQNLPKEGGNVMSPDAIADDNQRVTATCGNCQTAYTTAGHIWSCPHCQKPVCDHCFISLPERRDGSVY